MAHLANLDREIVEKPHVQIDATHNAASSASRVISFARQSSYPQYIWQPSKAMEALTLA